MSATYPLSVYFWLPCEYLDINCTLPLRLCISGELIKAGDKTWKAEFTYERSAPDQLKLNGSDRNRMTDSAPLTHLRLARQASHKNSD